MRIYFIFLLVAVLSSCNKSKPDLQKSRALTEHVIKCIQKDSFANFADNYSSSFFQKLNENQWTEDLKRLQFFLGRIQQYQLVEYTVENKVGLPNDIELVYLITQKRMKSHFIFTVIVENGKHKIDAQKISTDGS